VITVIQRVNTFLAFYGSCCSVCKWSALDTDHEPYEYSPRPYTLRVSFSNMAACGPLTGFQRLARMISSLRRYFCFQFSRKCKLRSVIGKISVYFNFFKFICVALQDFCTILLLMWTRVIPVYVDNSFHSFILLNSI
jgi:hypothetical protein